MEDFKPELSHDTNIYAAISVNRMENVNNCICGHNILFSEENNSTFFDYNINLRDFYNFFLICENNVSSFTKENIEECKVKFQELVQQHQQPLEIGNQHLFKYLFENFCERYGGFQTEDNITDLVEVLDAFGHYFDDDFDVR